MMAIATTVKVVFWIIIPVAKILFLSILTVLNRRKEYPIDIGATNTPLGFGTASEVFSGPYR